MFLFYTKLNPVLQLSRFFRDWGGELLFKSLAPLIPLQWRGDLAIAKRRLGGGGEERVKMRGEIIFSLL
jgi:hypothetical protein